MDETRSPLSVFSQMDFDAHEQVLFCHDKTVGLHGIIALHSTALGPAARGCRMYPYASIEAWFADPDYQEAMKFRHASSTMKMLLVQEGGTNTENPAPKLK